MPPLAALVLTALAAGFVAPQDPHPWAASLQAIVVTTEGWDSPAATVSLWARTAPDAPWEMVSPVMPGVVGRAGLGWGRGLHPDGGAGPVKREGDGRAPAGVFLLPFAFGYDPHAPGVRLPYRQATASSRCVDDPASAAYNRWVEDDGQAPRDWTSHEEMRRADALYRRGVWVAHNADPPEPGAGSCIFLHLRAASGAATVGCTALGGEELAALMRWLDPAARPVLVQLPAAEMRRLRHAWALP